MSTFYAMGILVTFLLGLGARAVKLPPLVGFLAGGFLLAAQGYESGEFIRITADLGVTLMLFTIGLKLRIKDLLAPEVWASASAHMIMMVALMSLGINLLAFSGLTLLVGLEMETALLIAFALSFSSTVFAVKVLEEQGESSSLHARVAIGMLIIQDIVAVLFMAYSKGGAPSPWSVLLLLLIPARGLLNRLAKKAGHGELLILYGMLLAFLGAYLFESLGIKGDFGALILGMLLAPFAKSKEMYKSLMGFKDVMLVGFFINIGLGGLPTGEHVLIALLLLLFMPFKMLAYFALLVGCKLRVRTALLTTFSLANYSEFGLIIAGVAVTAGWISMDWLIILALTMSMSFVIAAPINAYGKDIYRHWHDALIRFQRKQRIEGDEMVDPGDSDILIFGMGSVGIKAYDVMAERYGENKVYGVDNDLDVVRPYCEAGRRVALGDPTDLDFWERRAPGSKVKVIMLAMKSHPENMQAAELIRSLGYSGCLSATAHHEDQIIELNEVGVDTAYNIYGNAGAAFASYVCSFNAEPDGSDKSVT